MGTSTFKPGMTITKSIPRDEVRSVREPDKKIIINSSLNYNKNNISPPMPSTSRLACDPVDPEPPPSPPLPKFTALGRSGRQGLVFPVDKRNGVGGDKENDP